MDQIADASVIDLRILIIYLETYCGITQNEARILLEAQQTDHDVERFNNRIRHVVDSRLFYQYQIADMLRQDPPIVAYPTENLPEVIQMMETSLPKPRIADAIMKCPAILAQKKYALQDTRFELQRMCRRDVVFRKLIEQHPEALLIDHRLIHEKRITMEPNQDPQFMWSLISGQPFVANTPDTADQNDTEIFKHLVENDCPEAIRQELAAQMQRSFNDQAVEVCRTYQSHGWSFQEINILTKRRNGQIRSPEQVLALQKRLNAIPLDEATVHHLILKRPRLMHDAPEVVGESLETLHSLGFTGEEILSLMRRKSSLARQGRESILQEHTEAQHKGYGVLWKQQRVPEPEPVQANSEPVKPAKSDPPPTHNAPLNPIPIISAPTPKLVKKVLARNAVPHQQSPNIVDTIKLQSMLLIMFELIAEDPNEYDAMMQDLRAQCKNHQRDVAPENIPFIDEDDPWQLLLVKHDWIKNINDPRHNTFGHIVNWVPMVRQPKPKFTRSLRFYRYMLLGAGEALLRLEDDIICIRMHHLRLIDRDFISEPEWLHQPWENLDGSELHFRINEIEARGKKPNKKPFIQMMLEPNRADFLKRLDRYLEKKKWSDW